MVSIGMWIEKVGTNDYSRIIKPKWMTDQHFSFQVGVIARSGAP